MSVRCAEGRYVTGRVGENECKVCRREVCDREWERMSVRCAEGRYVTGRVGENGCKVWRREVCDRKSGRE